MRAHRLVYHATLGLTVIKKKKTPEPQPPPQRCKHDKHVLEPTRDLDASFFFNVGMVYLDTFLSFQPVEVERVRE